MKMLINLDMIDACLDTTTDDLDVTYKPLIHFSIKNRSFDKLMTLSVEAIDAEVLKELVYKNKLEHRYSSTLHLGYLIVLDKILESKGISGYLQNLIKKYE